MPSSAIYNIEKFFDFTSDAMIILGRDGLLIKTNRAAERLTGLLDSDVYLTPFINYVHPDDLPRVLKEFTEVLAGKNSIAYSFRVGRKGGPYVWMEYTTVAEGDIIYAVGRDITDRKLKEAALEESEYTFRKIVETSQEGIWIINENMETIYTNSKLLQILGCSFSDVMGQSPTKFTDGDYTKSLQESLEKRRRGITDTYDMRWKKLDGTYIWTTVSGSPFTDRNGKFIGSIGMIMDITERKLKEKALEDLDRFFSLSSDAILILNTHGRFLRVNDEFIRVFGPMSRYKSNTDFRQLIHPNDSDSAKKVFESILKGEHTQRYEARYTTLDGTYRWFSWSTILLPDQKIIYASGTDITETKTKNSIIEEQAKALALSNADLEQFAYVASHDLQEPLRMISSYTELLKKRYESIFDKDALTYMSYVIDGVTRMRALINDILTFSRIGRYDTDVVETSLMDTIKDALQSIDTKKVEISYDEMPTIFCNPSLIRQVFYNLVSNAVKFCDKERPIVHISYSLKGKNHVVCVEDNGIGIATENYDKVFLLFGRLNNKDKYPGTGIGLAICKKIIERYGGKIWVESLPNFGSKFFFTLPIRTSSERPKTD